MPLCKLTNPCWRTLHPASRGIITGFSPCLRTRENSDSHSQSNKFSFANLFTCSCLFAHLIDILPCLQAAMQYIYWWTYYSISQPSVIFQYRLLFHHGFSVTVVLSPFTRWNIHKLHESSVETWYWVESDQLGNFKDWGVCAWKQQTGMFDPCVIDKFQGTDSHDCVKCTSEMRDA